MALMDYPAGHHETVWEATDVPSGLYVCRLEADGVTLMRKLVLQK